MKAEPVFSIIVPTRNRPELLTRALRSLAEQTLERFEVLVVDDGSTEAFKEELRGISASLDSRFRFIWRDAEDPIHGPAITRNAGVAAAVGEYVGFLDDDDFWCDKEHLERALDALRRSSRADLFVANQVAVQGDAVVVDHWLPFLHRVSARRPSAGTPEVFRVRRRDLLRSEGIGFAHSNMILARRSTFQRIGGFWPGTSYEEDLDLFLRLVDASEEILYRDATVAVHSLRPDGARLGASSIDADSKLLLRTLACQHALLQCRRREVRAYAKTLLAEALKTLSRESFSVRKWRVAADYAVQAAAVDPSVRWILIAAYLKLRSILAPSGQGS